MTEKRDELRAKIEASERRNAQRTFADSAREAARSAENYARENPLTVVGGAIVVGVIIGALTPPGRRAIKRGASGAASAVSGTASTVSKAARKRSARLADLISDAFVVYGIKLIDQALDRARDGQDALEDATDAAAAKARELRRDAGYIAGSTADKTRTISRRASRKAGRAVRDLKDRVSR